MESLPKIYTLAYTLALSITLAALAAAAGPTAQAQTVSAEQQSSQTQSGASSGLSIGLERGNRGRTGVYEIAGAQPSGAVAWSTPKLFDIEVRQVVRSHDQLIRSVLSQILSNSSSSIIDGYYSGFDFCDPVVADGVLYFVMTYKDRSDLFEVDTRTGQAKLRSKRYPGEYSAPAVAGDTLYVGADSGIFYAVDLKTNDEKWRHVRGNQSSVLTSPLVAGGMVFYTSSDRVLYALDAETGKQRWNFFAKEFLTTPAATEDSIYFSGGKHVYALDIKTGKERWKFKATKEASSVVVADGFVYFRDDEGRIGRLDAATGIPAPKHKKENQAGTRLTVEGQTIYFVGWDHGSIFAVNAATGESLWKFSGTSDRSCNAPVISGDNLYVTCDDGKLYALDKRTGKKRWSAGHGRADLSAPAIADGLVFFISADGKVYGVR